MEETQDVKQVVRFLKCVELVRWESQKASDPVCRKLIVVVQPKQNPKPTIHDCTKLKNESHEKNISFLISKGPCFEFLSYSHKSRDCKKGSRCATCNMFILHYYTGTGLNITKLSTNETISHCDHMGAGVIKSVSIVMLILPVKLGVKETEKYI